MNTLASELRQVIAKRLEAASSNDIAEIVGQLCANDDPVAFTFSAEIKQRFVVAGGAVEDSLTGLIWSRDDIGERHTWADAKKAAAKVAIGGFTDWRLPTIKELLTIVDYDKHSPAIDKAIFPNCKADWYWTSTPYASSPGDCAWSVYFSNGFSYYYSQGSLGLVRAVRSRQ